MKESDSLMKQVWGPLNSEALFGTTEESQDHHVVSLLEEYHANYAQREQNKKLHETYLQEAYSEIAEKYKKRLQQLRKGGKPIPESLMLKLGNEIIALMGQKKFPAKSPPSSTSKILSKISDKNYSHLKFLYEKTISL